METKKLLLCSKGIKVCVCVSIYEITILKRSKTLVSIHKFRLPRSHEPNTNFYATVYRNVRVCMGFCLIASSAVFSRLQRNGLTLVCMWLWAFIDVNYTNISFTLTRYRHTYFSINDSDIHWCRLQTCVHKSL